MKTILKILLMMWCVPSLTIQAQHFETDTVAQRHVSQLSFLTGDWAGEGWMMSQTGERAAFNQTEKVRMKLDGTALLIEGKGVSNGVVIHNALAVLSYDRENGNYDFNSFLQNGRKGLYEAEMIDGDFYWYPGDNVRYIIRIDDDGKWVEKGEFKSGDQWVQFFEMTLERE